MPSACCAGWQGSLTLWRPAVALCRALRQRQARVPVLLLSTGGLSWHADARRGSIAAGIRWALEAGLQGLVLDSGAAQEQQAAVALARSQGLKVTARGTSCMRMQRDPQGHIGSWVHATVPKASLWSAVQW